MLLDLAKNVARWIPTTTDDKAAVKEQLERLLLDPRFRHSKRFPCFLRFGVDYALGGSSEGLKERTIGVEVFGRPPDYDTNDDPIVRVTAVEIRKRLSAYYEDPAHKRQLRIELPSGSYVPHFFMPAPSRELPSADPEKLKIVNTSSEMISAEPKHNPVEVKRSTDMRHFSRWLRWSVIVVAIVLSVAGVMFWSKARHESALNMFWSPFFNSSEPILICIANFNQALGGTLLIDANDPTREIPSVSTGEEVAVEVHDTVPLFAVVGMLQSRQLLYRVKGQAATTFADLQEGPVILVGAFDNRWTLQSTRPLRFHFANDPQMSHLWIEDRQKPQERIWVRDLTHLNTAQPYTDYALVARFLNPVTNRITVVAAGLGNSGTSAAGEFLANPEYLKEFSRSAPPGWAGKNIEIVLATTVIGKSSSAPHVVATAFW